MQEGEQFDEDMFPGVDTPPMTEPQHVRPPKVLGSFTQYVFILTMQPSHTQSATLTSRGAQLQTPATSFHGAPDSNTKIERQESSFIYKSTGYTWSREEDAPGYGWKNKKAVEDYNRASYQLVDKDRVIKCRWSKYLL